MGLGDFVKSIYVKIKVDGAEEAKTQMEEIALAADKLNHSDPTIKVDVDKNSSLALKGLTDQLKSLRDPKVSQDLRDLAARFHMLAATTDDARVRTKALAGELDALGKDGGKLFRLFNYLGSSGFLKDLVTGFGSGGGWQQALTSPTVWIAALAALPFLAQAAAGAIVLGLGGALTGIGIMAARGVRSVRYQFSQLSVGTAADFAKLGTAFGPALTTILSAARTFVPQFIASFRPALQAIAGPLASFGVMIAGELASPQVATSLREMGKAFGAILNALTPMVPGMFTAISDGFTNIARAIEKNPKPIADLLSGLAHLIGILLDVIAWLTQVAAYIEMHWIPAWRRTLAYLESWVHAVNAHFLGFNVSTTRVFDAVRNVVVAIWNTMWRETIGAAIHGVQTVEAWFNNLKLMILQKVSDFPSLLRSAGAALIQGLINGINSMIPGLGSVLSNITGWIKAHFPFSPAKVGPLSGSGDMFYAGRSIARGLAAGMDAGRADVGAAAMRLASVNPGGPMAAYAGAYPGGVLRLEVVGGGGGMLDRLFISWLKNYVRVAGGGGPQSVQRALGQVWR